MRDGQEIRAKTQVVVGVLCALFFAGCSLTSRSKVAPGVVAASNPSELIAWQATGRMGVSGVESGGSGSFAWVQNGSASEVQLRGPIGIGSLRLQIDGNAMRIDTGDGQSFEADAAHAEFASRIGAQVPTQNLRYWMLGIPAPGEFEWRQKEAGTDGAVLVQQDWQIEYQRFDMQAGLRLPTKLLAISGPVKVRILIDRWKALQ